MKVWLSCYLSGCDVFFTLHWRDPEWRDRVNPGEDHWHSDGPVHVCRDAVKAVCKLKTPRPGECLELELTAVKTWLAP